MAYLKHKSTDLCLDETAKPGLLLLQKLEAWIASEIIFTSSLKLEVNPSQIKMSEVKNDQKGDYSPVETNKVEQMQLEGEENKEQVGLKAQLGLVQGCNVIIGCIIGSGIFVSPGGVLMNTGSINMALTVWIICGVFSMIGAYCYAELGCLIKKSGGDYAYILDTFGPFIGFVRLWAECIVVRPCTITIVALTFSTYASKPFFPECDPPDEAIRALAAVCICKSSI